MNHLTPDELVDGAENALTGERLVHLTTCDRCRQQVEDLRHALRAVEAPRVPDPSPLFWTHLSNRVRGAIADEPRPRATWLPLWASWRVAVPMATLTLLVAALVTAVPHRSAPPISSIEAREAADLDTMPTLSDDSLDDVSWQLVSDLADELDVEDVPSAGFGVLPGSIERAASDLEPAERAELLRLLRAELARPES